MAVGSSNAAAYSTMGSSGRSSGDVDSTEKPKAKEENPKSSVSGGVVGAVIGGVVGGILLIVLAVWFVRRRAKMQALQAAKPQ